MMRLLLATAWVLLGGALAGGAYWAFLNTPESTSGSLILSAILLIVAIMFVSLAINGAIAAWTHPQLRDQLRRLPAGMSSIVPAILIVIAAWWLVGAALNRLTIYSGPINAWFVARFGWADMSWLFTAMQWIGAWLRWVVAPLVALSLVAATAAAGWTSPARRQWFKRAISPVRLLLATAWFAILLAAPWTYLAPWRPQSLPPNSAELAFIIVKLGITALVMGVGAALFIREASHAS